MDSKLGWILAGLFGGFIIFLIVWFVFFPQPTPPTRDTTGFGMLTLQKPDEPLETILPAEAGKAADEGDAGDDYQRALKLYQENHKALMKVFEHCEAVARDRYSLTDEDVNLLNRVAKAVAAGTARKKMTYYFRLTPTKIEIPYWSAEAEHFQDLASVPRMLAVHYVSRGQAEYPAAEKCLFDILVLGHHMIEERARLDIVRAGVGLEKIACDLLSQLYAKWQKPDRLKAVNDYRDGLRQISGTYTDLYGVIWRLEQRPDGTIGPNPGDVFNLVANHADRAVRVEAILGLGMVKLTCGRRGDHRKVRALIEEKLRSGDPIEQAAARCAEALDQDGLDRLTRGQ